MLSLTFYVYLTKNQTHIVEFDGESKIQQIRLQWDQASLLKSVEVIGTRALNWPIHDGKDQSRLISNSISHATHNTPVETKPTTHAARSNGNLDSNGHLSLFEPLEFERISSPRNAVEPRESLQPAPRPYDEVFGDKEPRSPSPTKAEQFKGGAGSNFRSNRLFDEKERVPFTGKAANPTKFDHFDMNETTVEVFKTRGRQHKEAAHWDFADFATPQKPVAKFSERNERALARTADESAEANEVKEPGRMPYRPTARKDAAAHFSFGDESPVAEKRAKDTTQQQQQQQPAESAPLSNITNNARKNFSNHFDISDASPPKKSQQQQLQAQMENVKPTTTNASLSSSSSGPAKAARNMMTTSWDFYNNEPVVERGIKIAGDGMGSRKTTEKSWWEIE